ncbi:uncharacterized protein LOC103578400 isoform X1 [Microplitis demolitor]|uniref:uncharacterized protein LOC103578400 isoform X1 n=1 Tax=Microplitis demolitor TaxID=69319 RepID=UPI00235B695C|nr:uncharacterized protein LOC103578400 isoform X1 [Microplitis demolitor]
MDNSHGAQEIFEIENKKIFEPNDILLELQSFKYNSSKQQINNRIKIFQKLLNSPFKITNSNWEPVLLELIEIITLNIKIRDTQVLLASHVLFTIFTKTFTSLQLKSTFENFLNLHIQKLIIFNKEFSINDLESFKLTIIYGFFLVINKSSVYFPDIYINSFEIIQRNCLTYSKYNYFAFNLLEIWLGKTNKTKFWEENDLKIEKTLESIIFSNWDHSIGDVAKLNASKIFPIYLNIMEKKYFGYLKYTFNICYKNLSWQSATKFIILSEICNIWTDCFVFDQLDFKIIITSLAKSHLKHVSTKLYLAIINKMTENKWIELIMEDLCLTAEIWERENNLSALQNLWDYWMRYTLNKFKTITIPLLWERFCKKNMIVCQSYLARKANELGKSWIELNSENFKINHENKNNITQWTCSKTNNIPSIINDGRDCVKLNIFAIQCRKNNNYGDINNYEFIKHFLYFNANTCSSSLRKGIIYHFEIIIKNCLQSYGLEDFNFILWLNKFIFDCFEPGSCYQRKIVGLKLYEIILRYLKTIKSNSLLTEDMENRNKSFFDKDYLLILLYLCLDHIDEIRQVSSNIIICYFDLTVLTIEEINVLIKKSESMKTSSKFYEICGGVKLLTIISTIPNKKNPYYCNNKFILYEKFFNSAEYSLDSIKNDLLKGFTEGSDLNGSIMSIKELFSNSNTFSVPDNCITKLLSLLEDSTAFLISALSPKSSEIYYSASFAEMGIAIEESIKNSEINDELDNTIVSPAHQIIISSIWMALKNICELAATMSITLTKFDYIKRSLDLMISVLMKCRHKGAIEAAGCALGTSIQSLTQNEKNIFLFDSYLNKLLNLDNDDKIDLTRRGAGMSIMFHKMIANYDKSTRRLLHIALNKILESLTDSDNKYNNYLNLNKDSPRARLLHFLRTIVADKSLHIDLVPYMEKISMICFEYLQSSEWAIRNASLQLLGAVIPRLIGQSIENEINFSTGYSINHFVTHYPILSEFVLNKLKDESAFKVDGNIVPVLTLLSRLSIGGCEFTDYSSEKYISELKKYLRLLFGHSVENVRYLAAKSYAALIPIQKMNSELFNMKTETIINKSRNLIHGHLLAQICIQQSSGYAGIWMENISSNYSTKELMKKFNDIQIKRAISMINYWTNDDEMYKKPLCTIIETTFLQNIIMLPMLYADKVSIKNLLETFIEIFKSKKNDYIGHSEMMNYLFKLNFLLIKLIKIDFLSEYLNQSYIYEIVSSANENVTYYFIKHLRLTLRNQKLNFKNLSESNFIEKRLRLFEFLLSCANLSKHISIEIVKLIIEIMKFDGNNRNAYLWYPNNKIADKILKLSKNIFINYNNKKMQQLAHMLNVLCTHHYHESNKEYLKHCYDIQQRLVNDIGIAVHEGDEEDKLWSIECLFNLSLFQFNHFFQTCIIESLISLLCVETNEIRTMVSKKFQNSEWTTQWDDINKCWIIISNDNEDFLHDYENFQKLNNNYKWNDVKNVERELKSPEIHLYELICVLGSLLYHKKYDDKPIQTVNYKCKMRSVLDTIDTLFKSNENFTANKSNIESPFDHDEVYREDIKIFNIFFYCIINQSLKYAIKEQYNYKLVEMSSGTLKDYVLKLTDFKNSNTNNIPTILNLKGKDYLKYKLFNFLEHCKVELLL